MPYFSRLKEPQEFNRVGKECSEREKNKERAVWYEQAEGGV